MEDSSQNEGKKVICTPIKIFIVIAGLPYGVLIFLTYISYISSVNNNFFVGTAEFIFYIIHEQLMFGTILGIILISFVTAFSYFSRMSSLSRIPINSSMYESITQSTIQYGPLKIILPELEDETLDELHVIEIAD